MYFLSVDHTLVTSHVHVIVVCTSFGLLGQSSSSRCTPSKRIHGEAFLDVRCQPRPGETEEEKEQEEADQGGVLCKGASDGAAHTVL